MTALVKPVTNFYTMTAAKNRRISQGSAVGGIILMDISTVVPQRLKLSSYPRTFSG